MTKLVVIIHDNRKKQVGCIIVLTHPTWKLSSQQYLLDVIELV